MITIDKDAKQNSLLTINIDYMTERYKTESNIYVFPSPSMWVIEKNLFYLLKNSVEEDFNLKYKMKPEYLSYDKYGTVVLSHLLMYINGVQSIEEFDLTKVIIPKMNAIINICGDKFSEKDISELTNITW